MKVTINIDIDMNDIEVLTEKFKSMDEVKERDVTLEHCGFSQYARYFDEACCAWTKDPEFNKVFLFDQQEWANERLKREGHLFLNDVYEMLGMPKSRAGQVVGWIYDEDDPLNNFVNFGLCHKRNSKFINGYERVALLDFNVREDLINLI